MKRSIWIWSVCACAIVIIPVLLIVVAGRKRAVSGEITTVVVSGLSNGSAQTTVKPTRVVASATPSETSDGSVMLRDDAGEGNDQSGDVGIVFLEGLPPLDIADLSSIPSTSPFSVNPMTIVDASPTLGGIDSLISQTLNQEFYGGIGEGVDDADTAARQQVTVGNSQPTSNADQSNVKPAGAVNVGTQGGGSIGASAASIATPTSPMSDLPIDFPAELLTATPGKEGAKAGENAGEKVGGLNPNKAKKKDDRPRVEVVVLRPRNDIVSQLEDVIGHSKVVGHPIVLVRSRQVASTWWVQEVLPRQGKYFRAVAQFGNTKSADGSRFQYVVAFVKDAENVPETGSEYQDIPPDFLVSEEFEVVVKRKKP